MKLQETNKNFIQMIWMDAWKVEKNEMKSKWIEQHQKKP